VGYPVKAIANYFIDNYGKHGITPLKLQKLVYLAHGWHYAFEDKPLVDDEFAEAWEYGPVFPSLYHEFKHRGNKPIMDLATEIDFENFAPDVTQIVLETPQILETDIFTHDLLDRIWEVYGTRTASQLSNLTHKPGSPWAITRSSLEDVQARNVNINNTTIRDHYKGRIEGPR